MQGQCSHIMSGAWHVVGGSTHQTPRTHLLQAQPAPPGWPLRSASRPLRVCPGSVPSSRPDQGPGRAWSGAACTLPAHILSTPLLLRQAGARRLMLCFLRCFWAGLRQDGWVGTAGHQGQGRSSASLAFAARFLCTLPTVILPPQARKPRVRVPPRNPVEEHAVDGVDEGHEPAHQHGTQGAERATRDQALRSSKQGGALVGCTSSARHQEGSHGDALQPMAASLGRGQVGGCVRGVLQAPIDQPHSSALPHSCSPRVPCLRAHRPVSIGKHEATATAPPLQSTTRPAGQRGCECCLVCCRARLCACPDVGVPMPQYNHAPPAPTSPAVEWPQMPRRSRPSSTPSGGCQVRRLGGQQPPLPLLIACLHASLAACVCARQRAHLCTRPPARTHARTQTTPTCTASVCRLSPKSGVGNV